MKVIIAGSRRFPSLELNDWKDWVNKPDVKQEMYILCKNLLIEKFPDVTEIVSGCAYGIDSLGINIAKDLKLMLKKFPADWSTGKGAGFARNAEMSQYADALLCVRAATSNGSEHMTGLMKMLGKPYHEHVVS